MKSMCEGYIDLHISDIINKITIQDEQSKLSLSGGNVSDVQRWPTKFRRLS